MLIGVSYTTRRATKRGSQTIFDRNLLFDAPRFSKQAQDDYQLHPLHVEFVEKVFKRVCKKVVVYDFE